MKSNIHRSAVALFIGALVLCAGCKSPFGRTRDPNSGPSGSLGGSGQFPLFSNELVTGGGAFEYPGGDNVSLVFDDHSNPISKRSIRFSWNGQPADGVGLSSTVTSIFAGFSLMHVSTFSNYLSTPGRDLRAAGYTKVAFYGRGSLSTDTSVKIEAGGPTSACLTLSVRGTIDKCGNGNVGVLSSSWQSYTLTPFTSAEQSAIKDFFKATFIFDNPTPGNTNPGQGGTLYLDQIFYKP